ncbi:MAG: flagellar hook capping FlgD N-terminal domain-containing protein [Lachnospiraceae bacterium]|nr:flagellar hook capping FlgD N-terminal domain-containing protein [Lachnospiraceae bacterium]
MAIIAPVENGKVVEDTTKSTKKDNQNTADKEMFLKLLVAEMQYQDPLEPTSNTDYVKELASFSQIEAVQAVQEQMTTIQANSLVGKYVILLTTGASGNQEYVSGKVDYVMTDADGEMFLSVNEQLYSIDDLDSVCDDLYYNAVVGAQEFHDAIESLPSQYMLTLADEEKITACRKYLDEMTTYQKQYISQDDVKKLTALEERLEELKKAAEGVEES